MASKDVYVLIYGLGNTIGSTDETMSIEDIVDFAEAMGVRSW